MSGIPRKQLISGVKLLNFFSASPVLKQANKCGHTRPIHMAHDGEKQQNGGFAPELPKLENAHDGSDAFSSIREGLADIMIPKNPNKKRPTDKSLNTTGSAQSVFYNPIQQFNRDLSVVAIKAYGDDLLAARRIDAQNRASRGKKRKRKTGNGDTSVAVPHSNSERTSREVLGSLADPAAPDRKGMDGFHVPEVDTETAEEPDADIVIDPIQKEDEQTQFQRLPDSLPAWKTKFQILDALSASGLRALRYAKEIPMTTAVVANDMSPEATASIARNIKLNKLEDKIQVTTSNAMGHMYNFASQNVSKYDVIDLDPYGTAAPFLDAAMQAINDGGLLCVTCTDAGLWASCGYPEKSYALYGGLPMKGYHSHESGLRLILHSIASAGAKYGISIEPLLSLSIDFYARVFVRVFRSQAEVKLLAGKTVLVYNCDSGCGAWKVQPLAYNKKKKAKDGTTIYKHGLAQAPSCSPFCEHCGLKLHLAGPMYGGPIHHPAFMQMILKSLPGLDKTTYGTLDRIEGMVSTALEESLFYEERSSEEIENASKDLSARPVPRMDPSIIDQTPFYFSPSSLSGVLHCQAPPDAAVRGALKHAGYNVTRSHAKPGSIKTNAPWSFLWDMMREWESQRAPLKLESIRPRTAAWALLQDRLKQSGLLEPTEPSDARAGKAADQDDDDSVTKKQEIVFDEELGRDPNPKHLTRYQVNPRANWGPMTRAR